MILWFSILSHQGDAQDLIENGDFEDFQKCPISYVKISYQPLVLGWKSPDGATPDYFNACSIDAGVPYNWAGKNPAYSGVGYVGIYLFGHNYREYIFTSLKQQPDSARAYILEFHYRLAFHSQYSIDRIYAKFRMSDGGTHIIPFLKDSAIDSNTGKWELARDTLLATGKEISLMIGNFESDQNTGNFRIPYRNSIPELMSDRAYYLVDKVSFRPVEEEMEFIPDEIYTFKNVEFDFDSSNLKAGTLSELNRLSEYLLKNSYHVIITGHTDDRGTAEYNMKLSLDRAEAVKNYLIDHHIDPVRIKIVGKGETEPIFSGISEEIRQKNRRVTFQIVQIP